MVARDPDARKVAHRLQKHGNRADVLAKRAVVLEGERERDAGGVVGDVAHDEGPKHDALDVARAREEERGHERERRREGDVADPAELFARAARELVGEEVEHHGGPARVAAPTAAEEQGPKDLRDGVVDRGRLEDAGEEVVPKTLDLHVFLADKAQVNEHVEAHEQLGDAASVLVAANEERGAERDRRADVGEVEEVEEVALREPKRHGHGFEGDEDGERDEVLFHRGSFAWCGPVGCGVRFG